MCRFVIYRGPPLAIADLVTRPAHSIIHQSYHAREREEPLNGDGFGVAWYAPALSDHPAVFRDTTPAWNNPNLLDLARVTVSPTILAHVRAATQGLSVIRTNCHPFTAGRYAFMHNGNVCGFTARHRRRILSMLSDRSFAAVHGTTDSEHMFGLFLDRVADHAADHTGGDPGADPLETMAAALAATIRQVAALVADEPEASTLNLAVTDGARVVVSRCVVGDPSRANTLYVQSGRRFVCDGDECRLDDPGAAGHAVLIASEPLLDHATWEPVSLNHLVLIDADCAVTTRPCDPLASA